jgi:predicted deacylase
LGGLCATLPEQFQQSGQVLVAAYLNVLRHYDMLDGVAEYASAWMVGEQRLVLAGRDGLWIVEPGFRFRETVAAGTALARIYDLYGHEVELVTAPCDGQVFGMRTRPPVHRGDWAVFFGKLNERLESPPRRRVGRPRL